MGQDGNFYLPSEYDIGGWRCFVICMCAVRGSSSVQQATQMCGLFGVQAKFDIPLSPSPTLPLPLFPPPAHFSLSATRVRDHQWCASPNPQRHCVHLGLSVGRTGRGMGLDKERVQDCPQLHHQLLHQLRTAADPGTGSAECSANEVPERQHQLPAAQGAGKHLNKLEVIV